MYSRTIYNCKIACAIKYSPVRVYLSRTEPDLFIYVRGKPIYPDIHSPLPSFVFNTFALWSSDKPWHTQPYLKSRKRRRSPRFYTPASTHHSTTKHELHRHDPYRKGRHSLPRFRLARCGPVLRLELWAPHFHRPPTARHQPSSHPLRIHLESGGPHLRDHRSRRGDLELRAAPTRPASHCAEGRGTLHGRSG